MLKDDTHELFAKFFFSPLICFLILFSPLIYGSITILPLTILEAASFLIFFVYTVQFFFKKKPSLIKIAAPAILIFLFTILVFFQLLPLPQNLLDSFSPATLSLYKNFRSVPAEAYTLSIYPEATISMLLQFLSVLALFFVVLNYADDGRKIKWLILTIISSGFLYAFYGIIHIMVQPPSVKFVISTFTNRNHFAAYLEMIIPLSIAYALVETNKLKKIIIVFLAVVMGVSLFLSLSRAGIVSFFLAMLLLVILLQIKRQTRKGIAIIITLLLFLSIFLAVIGFSPIAKRLGTIADPLKAMYGRIEVIKETPRLVKDFPVFGTGLGTFIDIFQKYKSFSMSARYRFSHNEPIQLLVETGILGFGLFFLFLLTYLMRIMNVWFKRRDPRAAYLTLGCFVGIFSIIFHSFFDFVFHVPANAFLFSIILALSFRIAYLKEKQDLLPLPLNRISVPYYLKFFIIILFCLFFIFIEISILKRYLAEQSFLRIKDKFNTKADVVDAIIEYKKSLKGIEKAIILNPLNSHYFEMKADILAEMGLREDLKSEVLQEWSLYDNSEKFLLGAERFYQQAINLNPTNADYHLKLGWIYGLINEDVLMKQEFRKSVILDPQNPKIRSFVEKTGG